MAQFSVKIIPIPGSLPGENQHWVFAKDGRITKSMTCEEETARLNLAEGETLMEGEGDPDLHYIVDGQIVAKPEKPGDNYVWSDGAWVLDAEAATAALRRQRDRLLTACDWTQVSDAPLDAETKAAWAAYRQALRDLPATTTDLTAVVWPEPPTI